MTKLVEVEGGGPQRIDRYDLVAEIATGGMATVYLARLSGMGGFQRNVAVKLLHPHLAKNAEFVEMFFDEARLAASIHHPNVVPILEVGEGEQGYYLVMEYIEGDTFASLLSKAAASGLRVPLEIALRIVVDMLAGLHAAHELKDDHGATLRLVHRDVSPQNILVGTDGVTRITDFGVARAASRLSETRAGQLKGKLAYMAPEQLQGEEEIDRRVDVFSAGVVLWEALSLKRLFKASNEAATLTRVLTDPIRSPREENADVPEAVAQVCMKALERDPNLRHVSCAALADALERAAMEAGLLASQRDVAGYLAETAGEEVQSHRQAIRDWLDRHESSGAKAAAEALRASTPPPPARRPGWGPPSATPSGWAGRRSVTPPPPDPTLPEGRIPTPPRSWAPGTPATFKDSRPMFELANTGAHSPRRLWIAFGAVLLLGLSMVWFFTSDTGKPGVETSAPRSAAISASVPSTASAPAQQFSEIHELEPAASEKPPEIPQVSKPETSAATRRPPPRPPRAPARRRPKQTDLENPYQ